MSIPNTEVETVSESTVPVVPSDWTEATKWLWGLDQREVKLAEWSAIVEWLTSTEFDDRTYLASEVAASLIERRAPASIKNQLVIKKGPPPKCRMTFEAKP